MEDTKGYVNLDYCVALILADTEDFSGTKYQKYLQWAILCFTDLNLFIMPRIKVAYLTPNDALQVDLPDDFMNYTAIGRRFNNKITTMSLNKGLITEHKKDDCGNPVLDAKDNTNTSDCSTNRYLFIPHYRNGQYVGEQYGAVGVNELGYYNIDLKNRKIQVDTKGEIILEYVSSGIECDGSAVVPRQCVQAIRHYIHWNIAEWNKNINLGEKERKRALYYNEYEQLKHFEHSFTMSEYLDMRYETTHGIPKR